MKTKIKLSMPILALGLAASHLMCACTQEENVELAETNLVQTSLTTGPLEERLLEGYACCPDESGIGCFDLGFSPDVSQGDPCPYGWVLMGCDDFVSLPDGSVQCL